MNEFEKQLGNEYQSWRFQHMFVDINCTKNKTIYSLFIALFHLPVKLLKIKLLKLDEEWNSINPYLLFLKIITQNLFSFQRNLETVKKCPFSHISLKAEFIGLKLKRSK